MSSMMHSPWVLVLMVVVFVVVVVVLFIFGRTMSARKTADDQPTPPRHPD